ncbi:MAG: phosphate/phosphite/phosphonate ABC transporter substrate-binding protein [Alphaproteobacteria bacterium]|nr:phosphate/phosphite/phosphonate ABC transporter substrate-binding protein [Alphaproteobacteria bacterium]MBU1279461.1 phosphate/phosphite/phosphonate ABC transporter substrate-binding protein [Alphaproteobacteria bacterium]MBU1572639.1 phosphate/phosphite/phosphonate ABC transporter substrate-binding protein [Alphaproteobacteria bacterium]MBU1830841.1 phosphate/phosphite/phosphonate ABC transporter substrate-binding protein [Alphaproteobacteria bacterium]MBU2078599.1 phosphate/phosphite/phos
MRFITATALAVLIAAPALAEGWKEDYQTLKFGVLSGENEKDRLMRTEPLRTYLENTLGVKVEIFTAGNYDGVVQAIAANQIEIARFGSSSYAAAYTATNGEVEPILTTIKKDGNTGYRSIVVTRCDSGIESLADAAGKIHAFADPDSTSGYAVPYFNFLTKEGFKPEEYFAAVPFSGSHEAGVSGVVNGTFDTASTYQNNDLDGIYQRMESKGMIEAGLICKIWESPEITSGPWTVRSNLPAELISDLTNALEAFPTEDPEGYALYSSFEPTDPNPEIGFTRVDRDRYQWIVDMRDWIKSQRRG